MKKNAKENNSQNKFLPMNYYVKTQNAPRYAQITTVQRCYNVIN